MCPDRAGNLTQSPFSDAAKTRLERPIPARCAFRTECLLPDDRSAGPRAWPLDTRSLPVFLILLATTSTFALGYLWNEDLWWYLGQRRDDPRSRLDPQRDPFVYSLPEPPRGSPSRGCDGSPRFARAGVGLWALPVTGALLSGAIVTLIFTRARLDRFALLNGLLTVLVVLASNHRFALKANSRAGCCWSSTSVTSNAIAALRFGERSSWQRRSGSGRTARGVPARDPRGRELQRRGLHPAPLVGTTARGHPTGSARVPAVASAAVGRPTPGRGVAGHARLAAVRIESLTDVVRRFFEGSAGYATLPVLEWQSTFSPEYSNLWWIYGVCLCLGGASFIVGRSRTMLARLFLFTGMAILGAYAVRFLTGFTIAAALVIMGNLHDARWPLRPADRATASALVKVLHASADRLPLRRDAGDGRRHVESRAQFEVGQSGDHFFSVSPGFTCPGAADYILANGLPGRSSTRWDSAAT